MSEIDMKSSMVTDSFKVKDIKIPLVETPTRGIL